jgi:CubicO group peptidase (beta-lactamase class C family)
MKKNTAMRYLFVYKLLLVFYPLFLFAQDSKLRISEPVDSVISELKSYIPILMLQSDIPGLSIALIRDNQIAWAEGFGVINKWSNEPVNLETVFEVASISKVFTAYIALRLVDQNKISLDKPVNSLLKEAWLPPSKFSDQITMRHLLSHSSGLGDDLLFMNKQVAFKPGSEFLYSGIGYMYTQEFIEQITGKSLREAAKEYVFIPLGMSNSSFVNEKFLMPKTSHGHISYTVPLLIFLVPFTITLTIILILMFLAKRIISRKWGLSRISVIVLTIISFIASELLVLLIFWQPFPNLIYLNLVCAVVFLSIVLFSFKLLKLILQRLPLNWQKVAVRVIITAIWIIVSFTILIKISGMITGPIPKNHASQASAIGSLRSSAPDLALFLIELTNPRFLNKDIAKQIAAVQISDTKDFSWGLGPGIQHSQMGDALWQNGITFGFRSVMVIYPAHGHGVVILTNSDAGLLTAYEIAQRALGGKAQWKNF